MPPDFEAHLGRGPGMRPLMDLLKICGITFIEGTNVTLTNNVLVCTNTPTELDKVEKLVLSISAYLKPKP